VVTVELTPAQVRDAPVYELRIVNPDGRQSNWVRLEIASNADGSVGDTGAVVLAQIPNNVTLTAASATIPVELAVKNAGRAPIRLMDFAVVTPDGTTTPVSGELEVPVGAQRNIRLETPVPFAIGAGSKTSVSYQLALTYRVTAAGPVRPGSNGRYPETGFATVAVRNEIALESIGHEYLRAGETNGADGWRFFKSTNPNNADQGTAADFYLFAEAFAPQQKRPTEALYNFRPDQSNPNDRTASFLTLRASEADDLTRRDARAHERGALLGYVATQQAPGLVPLYRWTLSDGRRTINHFLTTSNDASKLPHQSQGKNYRLEGPIGYVVPR
jgi:hypothetical protein